MLSDSYQPVLSRTVFLADLQTALLPIALLPPDLSIQSASSRLALLTARASASAPPARSPAFSRSSSRPLPRRRAAVQSARARRATLRWRHCRPAPNREQ